MICGNLRGANGWWLIAAAVTGTLIFPFARVRWRTILDPIAPGLPLYQLWRAVAIGMVGNNVLPARAGEFARAYVLSRETPKVSFSAAFASLAVDRVFDAFVVLMLMLVAMMSPAFPDVPIGGRHVSDYVYGGAIVATAALAAPLSDRDLPAADHHAVRGLRAPRSAELRGARARGADLLRVGARRAAPSRALLRRAHVDDRALAAERRGLPVRVQGGGHHRALQRRTPAAGTHRHRRVRCRRRPASSACSRRSARWRSGSTAWTRRSRSSWAIGFHLLTFFPITIIGTWYFTKLGFHLRDLQRAEADAA